MAFVLLRLFDIWKPFPVSWADRHIKGGFGVIFDDLLAGLLAAFTYIFAYAFLGPVFWGIGMTLGIFPYEVGRMVR